jgi:hypothetical protein
MRSQINVKNIVLRIGVLGLRHQGASQSVSFPTSRQVHNCLNDSAIMMVRDQMTKMFGGNTLPPGQVYVAIPF